MRMRVLIALFFAAGVIAFFGFDYDMHFSFENIQSTKYELQEYVEKEPAISVFVFGGIYAAGVALSLPISLVMSVLGGFLFGVVWGTLVIVIAATIGASMVFLVARYIFRDAFERRFGAYIARFNGYFSEYGFSNLLFLRFVPLVPFFVANVAPALTRVRVRDYIAATIIGTIPATAIFATAGKELAEAETLEELVSTDILLVLSLVAAVLFAPLLYIRWKKRCDYTSAGS